MLTTSAFRHLLHVLAATQNPAHRTMSEVNKNPDLSKGQPPPREHDISKWIRFSVITMVRLTS